MSKSKRSAKQFDKPDMEDFGVVDEDEQQEVKSKPKTKTTKKTHAVMSDSEPEPEPEPEDEEPEEKPVKKAKGKPTKAKELEECDEKQETEDELVHPCCGCEKEIACKDGKYKVIKGKEKFKCSCMCVKHSGRLYFFCNKKCKKLAEERAEKGQVSDDEGYTTA